MKLFSHRGYRPTASTLENTYESFEKAVAFGVDGIETDVRITADGELILHHDRFTTTGGDIATSRHVELVGDLGFEPPRVEEVLRRWPDVCWNLEIKAQAAVDELIRCIRPKAASQALLVTSFWHEAVKAVAHAVPNARCGPLVGHCPCDVKAEFDQWKRFENVDIVLWCFQYVDKSTSAALRRLGFRSGAWFVETDADHQRCVDFGVDLMITDHLEKAIAVLPGR